MLIRFCALFLAGIAAAAAQSSARPTNPAHVAEMPAPDRVMREITAPDPREAAARRAGAFEQLHEIVAELSNGRAALGNLTPDEERVMSEYRTARSEVMVAAWRGPSDDEFLRRFDADPTLRTELLARFFSPAFQAQSAAISEVLQARRAALRQENAAFGGGAIQPTAPAPAAAPNPGSRGGVPTNQDAAAASFPSDPSIVRARAAGVDTKVFGFELGEALTLPQCGLDNLLSPTQNCRDFGDPFGLANGLLEAFLGEQVELPSMIRLAPASCPAWSNCIVTASLEEGRLTSIDIPTRGPNVAAAVERELTAKYGRPTSFENHTVTPNSGGAEFRVRVLHWDLVGLAVEFQPVLETDQFGAVRVDEGLVRIETESAAAARRAAAAEQQRPKL